MPDVARTACRRCREQKLRCPREEPKCSRCTRLGFACFYPEPPNRKLLAASRRNVARKANLQNKRLPEQRLGANLEESTPNIGLVAAPGPAVDVHLPVRKQIDEILCEAYFSCVFNANLVFHRPTFEQAVTEQSLPQHVILAVYAMSTNVLAHGSALGKLHEAELQSLGDIAQFGRSCAIRAGHEVMQNIDQPTLQSVQSCQVLALYWFAQGDSLRHSTFSGFAFRAIRSMILDELGDRQASGKTAAMQAEVENVRRCFWSAWMMNCVVADHYITGSSADGHALALSLPMLESSYQNSIHDDRSTLAAAMTNFPSREKVEVPSIMAEMMKMIWFWIRVQDYIATRKSSPTADFFKLLFSLDDDLRQWNSQCHLSFTYSKHNLYKELGLKHQQGFVAVHALYHQCRMILHASLVPRLSGIVPEVEIPEELLKTSTEIVTTSARALSDLAADILNLRHEVAQLAPFVGYCMYVAAFIHLRLARSPNGLQARQDLRSSLRLLKAMKPYWKVLERLWIRLSRLHEGGTGSESATNTMAPPSRRANQLEVELNGPSDSSRFSDGLTKLDGFPVLRYSLDCAQDPHYARHNSSTAVRLEALIESGQDGMQEQRNGSPSYDSNACWSADKLVDNSIENFVPTSILDTEYSPFPPVGEGTIDFSDVDEYLRLAVSSFTDTDWWQIGQESASHTI